MQMATTYLVAEMRNYSQKNVKETILKILKAKMTCFCFLFTTVTPMRQFHLKNNIKAYSKQEFLHNFELDTVSDLSSLKAL